MARSKASLCRLFCALVLLLIRPATQGQAPFNPDSLIEVVESGAPLLEKASALQQLSDGYVKTDPGLSLSYSDQLRVIALKLGDQALLTDFYWLKGRAYLSLGSYDTSLLYCDSGIAVAKNSGLVAKMAEINITKGGSLFYSQGPEQGLTAYQEGYRLFSGNMDSAGMAKALNGIGVMYKKLAQLDSAVACYIRLITIAEKKGYESSLGMGYLNLGILYQDIDEYEKAGQYLTLSIPINEKYRMDLVALAHMNIGLVNSSKGVFDTALAEFRIAEGIYRKMNARNALADLYNNIGNLYYHSSIVDSAYHYFVLSRDLYKEMEQWYTYAQVCNNMSLVLKDRGKNDQALQLLDTSQYYAEKTKNAELLPIIYQNRYIIYNRKSDYKNALKNYLVYDSLQEIIYNLDKDKMMADLEMKYQNQKKQAQILTLEKTNLQKDLSLERRTRQRNAFLFSGIGIILVISFAFLYFRQKTVKDRIIAQQRIRQLEEEKKLLAARSLVEGQEEERKRIARELHDGLGVLLSTTKMQFSAIRDKLPENQALFERAVKLLEQASSDVRKISHNMMPGLLTKLGLYEAVADLFEKVSESQGMTVRASIPEEAERLPENKEIMVYRIVQELVNNTLKHAEAKTLEIRMQVMPGHLDIYYSDDGKGFNMEEKAGSKSIGLQSIESRVNFLNGKFQMYSAPGKGVSYKFEIPL